MDRDAQHDAARRNAWETATSVAERIQKLTQVASDYPESMTTFADLATSYLDMHDLDKARTTYQHIVDHHQQLQRNLSRNDFVLIRGLMCHNEFL
jgi:hypothetical protein